MTSLTQQMEQLQEQQRILDEKIKEDEERNRKLNIEGSVERLEVLIEPITQHLDWINPIQHSRRTYSRNYIYDDSLTRRVNIMENFKKNNLNKIKYQYNQMLGNEEIFVTLLGIVKKQDARIRELENVINSQ
jgi:hypothetical protein